jgi:3-dehydroquinate dehydratase/shikimate dehydrogenase
MSEPLICQVVTGGTADAIRRARDAVVDADLVELRLDSMTRPDPAAALADRRRPVIATCRPVREGGWFDGSEEDRLRILDEADALGAEFVDVEWGARFEPILRRRRGRGVIVSVHDFEGVPKDIADRAAAMRSTGAEVVKISVRARSLSDLLPLAAIARPAHPDAVLIAMGPEGLASRVLAARFGSRWTYAGDEVAPGQMPAARLLQEFRFRRIRHDASLYAVVGRPVLHSLSPSMHNAGFAALDLNAAYVPLEAADVADFRRFADAMGLRGASVTAPFKVAIMSHLDEIAPIAADVGAVNTIVIQDRRTVGTNTDVEGFLEPLRRRTDVSGLRATVLGAGGAARAVAAALVLEGAVVTIVARRADEARALAERFGARAAPWPPPRGSWDLLVNATTVGSASNPGEAIRIGDGCRGIVYDLVYEPERTPLLDAAEAAGCVAIGGLEMLIAQAERQFELWTGQRPPAGLFADAAAQAATTRRKSREALSLVQDER